LLEVTPHVTPDNRISMDIVIEKNDVLNFVEGVPVISTNEATTQLLVNDGDTIVIGGIIKSTSTKEKNAFPGLHKIPVLGWLFQSNLEDTDDNELLIFMNPENRPIGTALAVNDLLSPDVCTRDDIFQHGGHTF
jgi:type IV pilus assembly protein PilQ